MPSRSSDLRYASSRGYYVRSASSSRDEHARHSRKHPDRNRHWADDPDDSSDDWDGEEYFLEDEPPEFEASYTMAVPAAEDAATEVQTWIAQLERSIGNREDRMVANLNELISLMDKRSQLIDFQQKANEEKRRHRPYGEKWNRCSKIEDGIDEDIAALKLQSRRLEVLNEQLQSEIDGKQQQLAWARRFR